MPHFYLVEDELSGEIAVYDETNAEIIRFQGENALGRALEWVNMRGFDLRSNLSHDQIAEIYRLFFRRGLRRLRLFRNNPSHQLPKDPPNVQRIIVPDFSDFFDDDEESFVPHDNPFAPPEEVELTPTPDEDVE